MSNLIAYIPVLNQRHIDWLKKHPGSHLFLIPQSMAEQILPHLNRNMGGVSTETTEQMIRGIFPPVVSSVAHFSPDWDDPDLGDIRGVWKKWILPDEDISHHLAEKYLLPAGCEVSFEMIWSRWDMTAVKMAQPVIPDCEVSLSDIDIFRIKEANALSQKSPDWWRQIGAIAFRGDELVAVGVNKHHPSEYETYIFGDPRLNFNAGDPSGMDAYVSLHAEEYLVAFCARNGIPLMGASLFINTFPCGRCARVVGEAGFRELFFHEGSSFLKGFEILKSYNTRIVQVRYGE